MRSYVSVGPRRLVKPGAATADAFEVLERHEHYRRSDRSSSSSGITASSWCHGRW